VSNWWKGGGSGALTSWLQKNAEIWTVEVSTGIPPGGIPVDSPPQSRNDGCHFRATSNLPSQRTLLLRETGGLTRNNRARLLPTFCLKRV